MEVTSEWVKDPRNDELGPGDVVVTEYRGDAAGRFLVLAQRQTMWQFRDPSGAERPMKASTILHREGCTIEKASPERRRVFEAVAYIRANDCDFLTAANVSDYSHESEELARECLLEMGFSTELVG